MIVTVSMMHAAATSPFAPVAPHGQIEELFPDVFRVRGSIPLGLHRILVSGRPWLRAVVDRTFHRSPTPPPGKYP